MVLFVASCVAFAAGLLALAALARGHVLLAAPKPSPRFHPRGLRQLGLACTAGVAVLALTRWPAAALATGGLVAFWPKLTGGSRVGQRTLEKLESLATWTESLRDTAGAASGLEQAIPATVPAAPAVLRRPLRDLAARLDGRVPLPEALAH
jgi:tight adherence protein B